MSDVVYLGRFKHDMLLETAKIFVVIEMTAVFSVVWLMFYADRIRTPYYFWGDVCIIALFMAAYGIGRACFRNGVQSVFNNIVH